MSLFQEVEWRWVHETMSECEDGRREPAVVLICDLLDFYFIPSLVFFPLFCFWCLLNDKQRNLKKKKQRIKIYAGTQNVLYHAWLRLYRSIVRSTHRPKYMVRSVKWGQETEVLFWEMPRGLILPSASMYSPKNISRPFFFTL